VLNAKLDETALAWADKIAGNAPMAVRTMKTAVRRSMSEAHDAYHEDILEMARKVRAGKDAKEGIRAFLEKRKPVWRAE
jgi:crotonobetainyl-CoA hydratase